MSSLPDPHDRFFKDTLSRREEAREFLLTYLPQEVARLLDADSLELAKDSFVDKELRKHFSDLLYRVNLRDGRGAYVYLLFEHKSYSEPLIALDLLRYLVRIWEQWLKQGGTGPLPPIIPWVVYHGERQWQPALDFGSLVGVGEPLSSFVPDFRYLLCDLTGYSDEKIRGGVILRVALLLLKYIFREDLEQRLPEILGLLRELSTRRSGLEYLETILRYLAHAAEGLSEEGLKKAVEAALQETGGGIMPTLAEKWIEQGLQQGLRRGLLEGIELDLELKFGSEGVAILPEIYKIEDVDLLRAIQKGLKTVQSLEELRRIYQ
ncbi:MAG: Rpn family recombination-promoting nuclease/putative transposase [Chloroflexi bacterium]|nr:Rpn family recombination-promoting nuclease/putative transposase [Chloroflexota bacterium]